MRRGFRKARTGTGESKVAQSDVNSALPEATNLDRFRGDVQGLRALAVLAVVAYHSGMPGVHGGYVGVDMFFVVSGFLITGHLYRELLPNGGVDFGDFYLRRARRILPASFAVIVLTAIAAVIWQPPLQAADTLKDAVATTLYVPNFLFAIQGTDYLAETAPSAYQHYWSLGVEEQFYLIWPVWMLIGFKLARGSRIILTAFLLATTLLSLSLSIYLTPINPPIAFFLLPSRAWELAAGGVLAIAIRHSPRLMQTQSVGIFGWLGLAMIGYAIFQFDSQTRFPGWAALIPVVGTILVILAGSADSTVSPKKLLSIRSIVFIGTISYSLYLVHWPLLVIPQDAVGLNRPLPLWATLTLGFVAIPIGWLFYRYVEQPMRSTAFPGGVRFRRSLATGIVISIAIAAIAGFGIRLLEAKPLNNGVAVEPQALVLDPAGTDFVPSNLQPGLWKAADSYPAIYSNGCHLSRSAVEPKVCKLGDNARAPTVALFGDSHAAQWYPALEALAEHGDVQLQSITKSACPSAAIEDRGFPQCSEWRDRAISLLNAAPPDYVLLANHVFDYDESNLRTALESTASRLSRKSKVIVVADTPNLPATPAICLSGRLDAAASCSVRRQKAFNQAARRAERESGLDLVDLNNWICNEEWCPAIINSYLVYRDAHHLAVAFSRALAPAFLEQLLQRAHLGNFR